MNDFISLTCPTCGGAMTAVPGQESLACPYCGNEHRIRQEDGAYKLEAFARCPVCKRNDKVQKASAVVRANPQMAAHFQKQNQPQKPALLKMPDKPEEPKYPPIYSPEVGCGSYILTTFSIALVVFIVLYTSSGLSARKAPWDASQLGSLAIAVVIGLVGTFIFYFLRNYPTVQRRKNDVDSTFEADKKRYAQQMGTYQQQADQVTRQNAELEHEYQQQAAAWRARTVRLEDAYYCQRDDVLFYPGDDQVIPVK